MRWCWVFRGLNVKCYMLNVIWIHRKFQDVFAETLKLFLDENLFNENSAKIIKLALRFLLNQFLWIFIKFQSIGWHLVWISNFWIWCSSSNFPNYCLIQENQLRNTVRLEILVMLADIHPVLLQLLSHFLHGLFQSFICIEWWLKNDIFVEFLQFCLIQIKFASCAVTDEFKNAGIHQVSFDFRKIEVVADAVMEFLIIIW